MRSRTFAGVAALLCLLLVGAGVVYAYDNSKKHVIAKGIRVGGVDVGGMTDVEAKRALAREYVGRLRRPIVVRAGGKRYVLTARQARIGADLEGSVQEAVDRSRSGDIVSRTVREVRGSAVHANIEPQLVYSSEAVGRLVRRVDRDVAVAAKNASVTFSLSGPSIQRGHEGRALRAAKLRQDIESAIVDPTSTRRVTAQLRRLSPKQSTRAVAAKYPAVLVVDRGSFQLRLYRDLRLVKTYSIAVGQAGLDTPAGLYHIQNKAVDPAWHVPNSAWAGDMAGKVVPPGPDNPIKARWLGIFAGAGIHGTTETYSLGHAASHGCVRMAIPDVIELYPQVPVGAPIYIA